MTTTVGPVSGEQQLVLLWPTDGPSLWAHLRDDHGHVIDGLGEADVDHWLGRHREKLHRIPRGHVHPSEQEVALLAMVAILQSPGLTKDGLRYIGACRVCTYASRRVATAGRAQGRVLAHVTAEHTGPCDEHLGDGKVCGQPGTIVAADILRLKCVQHAKGWR